MKKLEVRLHVFRRFFFIPACVLFFVFEAGVADAAGLDLKQAGKLITDGKAGAAYDLLEPYELEQAGNPQFDYLLGLAALENDQFDQASVIFERVLAVDPENVDARTGLGRSYLALGDKDRARTEFSQALLSNPNPSQEVVIQNFLAAIDPMAKQPVNRIRAYVEGGVGYNDNVNNSTTQNQIFVPGLTSPQFSLNASNIKTGDSYLGLNAGGEVVHLISSAWSLYAGADAHSRNNLNYSAFNFKYLDARVGAIFKQDAEQFRAGLLGGQFDEGGSVNHNYTGLNAEWRHSYDQANRGILFGQFIHYHYPDPLLASNNFNQAIGGLGWLHMFTNPRTSVLGSVFAGNEQDTNMRIDGGKQIAGLSLSGQLPLNDNLDLFGSVGFQWGKYDLTNSIFLVMRNDQRADLTTGLNYRFSPKWSLSPQLSLVRNQSNIIIDKYDQADFSLMLRMDFQ